MHHTPQTPLMEKDARFQAVDLSSIQRICESFVLATLDLEIRTKSAKVLWIVNYLMCPNLAPYFDSIGMSVS